MCETDKNLDALRATLRHLHGVAAQYHQHFSTVRTLSSSLLIPTGFIGTIQMLVAEQPPPILVPLLFFGFVWAMALVLNITFARWSDVCRKLERRYEKDLMTADQSWDHARLGFRHAFHELNKKEGEGEPNPYDPFFKALVGGGILYLLGYAFVFHRLHGVA